MPPADAVLCTARGGLFRWRPEGDVEFLCRLSGWRVKRHGGVLFCNGAAIIGSRIYFPSGPHLMSMRLPLEVPDKQRRDGRASAGWCTPLP